MLVPCLLYAIKVVVSHFRDCFLCTSSLFTAATTVDRIVGDYDLWPNLATTIVAPSLKLDKFSSFQIRLFYPIFECWTLHYVSILCVCVWLWRGGRRWMEVCVGACTCEVTFCNYISHQEWWLGVTDAPPCTTLYNLLVPPCTTSTHHLPKPLLLLCSAKNWPQD